MRKPQFFLLVFFSFFALSIHPLFSAPIVTSIAPFFGPSAGGTVVSISGSGFAGTSSVLFGTTPAIFVVNSDSLITATSPIHSPEVVFVTVTTPEGSSPNTPEAYFVYQGHWEAFVSNGGSASVSAIDTTTNVVIATVPTSSPASIAIQPNGTKVYVNNITPFNNTILIDTATHTLTTTIPVGDDPIAIEVTPDGTQAYVVNRVDNTVSVINTTTNTVIATVPVGTRPLSIAITPDGTQAYVVNRLSNSVSVINTTTNTVIATVPVGTFPISIAITADGTQAYVANEISNNISVINTLTNMVIATIPVGTNPNGIAITLDGTQTYITNTGSNNVSVINTATNTVIATVPVGLFPAAIAIIPDESQVYIANLLSNNISVINTATNTVIATIPVGLQPNTIAITPDGIQIYVANSGSGNVSVINSATNSVIATVPVGNNPATVEITPDQAPLARFQVILSPATLPSAFDASESISPVGTIANYFWNFGDGTTLNTTEPVVFHSYALPGNYLVSLTVTNSAGTSTTQIFNPNSVFLAYHKAAALMNNGGPSAFSTQSITILPLSPPPPNPPLPPLPPRDFKVRQIKNRFATQTDIINILTWKAPSESPTPVAYRIYRNQALTKLVAEVRAGRDLEFVEHNRKKDKTTSYFIVSVDRFGNVSSPTKVEINRRCR